MLRMRWGRSFSGTGVPPVSAADRSEGDRRGARPTTAEEAAKEYSDDRVLWHRLPEGLSPVTGKLDAGATALVFDMMTTDASGTLDLWEYGELSETPKPLRFVLGCSTVCSVRKDTKSHPEKMKSRYRGIVAVARFADPFCAWVR